jgi:hypothetical protein
MGYTEPGGHDYLYVGSRGILSTRHAVLDPTISKIVRLTRLQFLDAVDQAQPDKIYRGRNLHFIYYDQFLIVTFNCSDDDFTQPIEPIDIEWHDEPSIVPMKPDARHYLDDVGSITLLKQLEQEYGGPAQPTPLPKVPLEHIDRLTHCPRCSVKWNESPQQCPSCNLTLYEYIDLPKTWYSCYTCSKRIYNYEVQLQRDFDGHIKMICPYCHKDLQQQSLSSAVIHWAKYPLLIRLIVFGIWAIMTLLGRDVLFWG